MEAAVLVPLGDKLRESLPPFYDNMEEPLAKVLTRMELDGVKVDLSQLKAYAEGDPEEYVFIDGRMWKRKTIIRMLEEKSV